MGDNGPFSLHPSLFLESRGVSDIFQRIVETFTETNMKDNGPPQPLPLLRKEDLKIFTLYNTITHALVAQYLNISIPPFLSVKLIYLFQKVNFNGQWTIPEICHFFDTSTASGASDKFQVCNGHAGTSFKVYLKPKPDALTFFCTIPFVPPFRAFLSFSIFCR